MWLGDVDTKLQMVPESSATGLQQAVELICITCMALVR